MSKFKDLANNSFFKREYQEALLNYSLALKDKPDDKEAHIGALLADMANEREEEAMALFEYYEASKALDAEQAHKVLEQIIDSVDDNSETMVNIVTTIEDSLAAIDDGILFDDFIAHVSSREDIKVALEDLMFSTKIIIYKKENFMELIQMLIENNFIDLAYNYIEHALILYPQDSNFYMYLKKLEFK